MSFGLRNGLGVTTLYVIGVIVIRLVLVGSLDRLIMSFQEYDMQAWLPELAIVLGIFAIGVIHGVSRAPIGLLIGGLFLIPCPVYVIIMANMNTPSPPDYTYWLFALCNTTVVAFPSVCYWLLKRYKNKPYHLP